MKLKREVKRELFTFIMVNIAPSALFFLKNVLISDKIITVRGNQDPVRVAID